jgi:subtilisin-like proprotein convertase family protein
MVFTEDDHGGCPPGYRATSSTDMWGPTMRRIQIAGMIFVATLACMVPVWGAVPESSGSDWTPLSHGGPAAPASVRVLAETSAGVTLEILIPGFSTSEVTAQKSAYTGLDIPGCGQTSIVGQARLPILRRAVEIPQGAEATVEMIEHESSLFDLSKMGLPREVYPVQPPIEKMPGAREAAEFQVSKAFYASSKPYPESPARIVETGQVRGHRYALVEVAPVTYRPAEGTIEVMSRVKLRITTPGGDEALTGATIDRYASPRFERTASNMLLNYRAPSVKAIPALPVGYLIITDPDFYDAVADLAEWKASKGYYTTVTTTGDIPGGATTAAIKNYILDAWQTWDVPPSFVLLVGDVEVIPEWTGTETDNPATDLYYSTMTSPDYIPDLGIGRLSVTTPEEASVLTAKIVQYEKALWGGTSWLKKAVFMASEDNYSITEGTHDYVISTYLSPAGFACDKLYCHTYNATTQQVRDALNAGRGLAVYSGHGAVTYWADGPQFTQSDVAGLTNLDMYPFIQSYACLTGDYSSDECFAETWIRETDKAALGFWASSVTSYWDEDDVLEKGVFRALFDDGLTWISGMTDQGKWYLYQYYGGGGSTKRYYEMYNLLGDPSLDVWTEEPSEMTVVHTGTCPVGAPSYPIHIEGAEGPLADALACVDMPDEVYESGYSDVSGDAVLDLDPAPPRAGEMYLTVTCHNLRPFFDTVDVVVPAVVTLDPDTIQVETPTAVTVTVQDTLYEPVPNVVVNIEGWGLDPALVDTTDALGRATIMVDAPYGEVLRVKGREVGETYDCFEEPLVVAGALVLPDCRVEGESDIVGLSGALTPGFEGLIKGSAGHAGLDMYATGCGIEEAVSSPADSAVIQATPTGLGDITVALAFPGYDVHTEGVPVIEAYGVLAGAVIDASSGDSLAGAAISVFPAGADTSEVSPLFETASSTGGTYAAPDSMPVGFYDVYAVKFGYLAYAGSTLVRFGANGYDIGMTPAPSGVVSGTVCEAGSGRPLTAAIDVYRVDDMSLYTEADSDSLAGGAFSTGPLPYFTYRFRVSAPHYMTTTFDVTVDEAAETVDVEMTPTQGNLLVIDDYTGSRSVEAKIGPKGEVILPGRAAPEKAETSKAASLIAADLIALGYDVTTETSGSTGPETWKNYDLIISSSGDDASPVAIAAYRAALNAYVTDGGKLLIEGGEVGYDAASSPGYPNFADTTLHVTAWQHDASGNLTVELPGHPLATSPNAIPATLAMTYSGYGDQDAVLPDDEAEVVFDWSSYAGQAGILVYDDTPDPASARIVYYAFDYANITDASARKDLLENTIACLLAQESTPAGSISGHVEISGQATYEGAVVRTSPMGLSDTTDASGAYLIEGLYDAVYQVTAGKEGFSDSTVTVEISGGETATGIDFTLYPVLEYSDSPGMAIPDNNPTGIRVYMDVPADAVLASVDCHVGITHTYRGDLVVELTSPQGTTVRLHNRTGGSAPDIDTWYDLETEPDGPGTMADFTGEPAEGAWELYVADLASVDTGKLDSWALRLAFPPETSGLEEAGSGIPGIHFFAENRPNPFRGETSFRFGLPEAGIVRLSIYDVRGRMVATLAEGTYPAGIHTVTWDGRGADGRKAAGGVYFGRLAAGRYSATRRIVYMR